MILNIADNGGLGLPENFDINKLKSLGLELVTSLADQLKGELKIITKGRMEFQIVI